MPIRFGWQPGNPRNTKTLKRRNFMTSTPFLSVIVPAYNEANRIGDSLTALLAYLQKQPYTWEVLVVDDGSRDQTVQVVESRIQGIEHVRLIACQPNRGKGFAVRQGVLASTGERVLFTDADLSTPVTEIENALAHLNHDCDLVIGSRAIAGSAIARYQPLYRRLGARVFNLLRDGIVGVDISRFKDTQCGFKAFQGTVARDLFIRMSINGFMFDVEMLCNALKLGYRIGEMPVHWQDVPGSKVRLVRDTLRMFRDLAIIRLKYENLTRRERA
jgi:dolichyl-phosphate beta-glucosyltransferase